MFAFVAPPRSGAAIAITISARITGTGFLLALERDAGA